MTGVQERKVDCNGCTVCCRREVVLLIPGYDDPVDFPEAIEIAAPHPLVNAPTTRMLPHRPDGACVYLGMHGCTIYAKRPVMCRAFSCVGYVERALEKRAMTPSRLRRAIKSGEIDADVWAEGMKRINSSEAA
jgi:Fe-S-cluster containining protein